MAVAFDAVGAGNFDSGSITNITWSHTVSGSNRILLVGIAVGVSANSYTAYTRTVTCGGVAMTSLGAVNSNNSNGGWSEIFYLLNPNTGAQTVSVTISAAVTSIIGNSVSYTGASGVSGFVTNFGNSASPSVVVTSASGNYAFCTIGAANSISAVTQTQRYLHNINTGTAASNASVSDAAGAASVTFGATIPSDWWGAAGVSITASAGATSQGSFFRFFGPPAGGSTTTTIPGGGGGGGTPAINRPVNPAMINYDNAGTAPGSNVSNWAHKGALIVVGRTNYNDTWVHTVADGGATVLIYLDTIVKNTTGRYHDKLFNASEYGAAVPLWPGSPVANSTGSLADFRSTSVLQTKLPGVLTLIASENPHISGIFMDDLGTRSFFPGFDFDSWSSTDKEAYRNGAIAIAQSVRSFADNNNWFVMVNGTWNADSGSAGSGGYPTRNAHGCSLADGGFVENHDPSTEMAFWTAYAGSTQWASATPRGVRYMWFSNRSNTTARDAWVAADVAAYASATEYNGPNPAPWKAFTDFGIPNRGL